MSIDFNMPNKRPLTFYTECALVVEFGVDIHRDSQAWRTSNLRLR